MFISYWDSGFIAVDVTNPANPTFEGRTDYDDDEDGDGHSASFDDARELLFTADEDFCKNSGPEIETGFGYLRVFDYSDLGSPTRGATPRRVSRPGVAASAQCQLLATEEVVAIMSEFHPAGYRAMARAFAEADLRDVLPQIDVPTLLLYGDADTRLRCMWLRTSTPRSQVRHSW